MAKAPVSGAVKSRLVPPLTDDEAAALKRCFIRNVCASIKAAAAIQAAAAIIAAQENTPVAGRNASAVAGNADIESENARIPDSNEDSINRRRTEVASEF
jgi:hypothetical protein